MGLGEIPDYPETCKILVFREALMNHWLDWVVPALVSITLLGVIALIKMWADIKIMYQRIQTVETEFARMEKIIDALDKRTQNMEITLKGIEVGILAIQKTLDRAADTLRPRA
jgi:septal ring factor EnvC (AmiA/AmiB activator)